MPTREPPEADIADQAAQDQGDPIAVAREIALRQLTVRARSRVELARALKRKGTPDDVAGAVLDRLEEVGLVDDEAFAREWLAAGERRRRSRSALVAELGEKGVDRDVVARVVAELDSERDYLVAREYAESRVRGLVRLDPSARYRRLAGALARRGFPAGVVAQVTREVLAELAEAEPDDPVADDSVDEPVADELE